MPSFGTIFAGTILVLVVMLCIRSVWKSHKNGGACASCSGGCNGCGGHCDDKHNHDHNTKV